MILTPDALRRIFQTLYGYRWAEEAAKHMGVSLRTIRAWTGPHGHVPPQLRTRIVQAINAKTAELESLRERVSGVARPSSDVPPLA